MLDALPPRSVMSGDISEKPGDNGGLADSGFAGDEKHLARALYDLCPNPEHLLDGGLAADEWPIVSYLR